MIITITIWIFDALSKMCVEIKKRKMFDQRMTPKFAYEVVMLELVIQFQFHFEFEYKKHSNIKGLWLMNHSLLQLFLRSNNP
jgi:hypothetical protein